MQRHNISLEKITENGKNEFKKKIQEAFGLAIMENFGETEPIPSDKELEDAFNDVNNDVYFVLNNNKKIGGAVIKPNSQTRRNSLELFFIYAEVHGLGLGLEAWKTIEREYPKTKVWETVTPYFEKRNINFYVNKCGFHIVEFCNKHHRCSQEYYNQEPEGDIPGTEEFFRFEKIVKF